MNRRTIGTGALAVAMAAEPALVIAREDRDLPHMHEESRSPDGPNTKTLSFPQNGAATFAVAKYVIDYSRPMGEVVIDQISLRVQIKEDRS